MRIARITRQSTASMVRSASFFSGANTDEETAEFSLPEDITTLSAEELDKLHATAIGHFDTIYGDGTGIQGDTLETLNALTEAIETLAVEKVAREEVAEKMAAEAAELAARARGEFGKKDDEEDEEETLATEDGEELATETASTEPAKRTIKLPGKSSQQARRSAKAAEELATKDKDVSEVLIAVGEGLGLKPGTGTDWLGMGKALDARLKTFNHSAYLQAHKIGPSAHLRDVGSLAQVRQNSEFVIQSDDRSHIDSVIKSAANVARLRQPKSLLASGGWHGASETLYNEFLQLEESKGGLSTPEVVLARGGAQLTPGTSFAEIFAAVGFDYTEQEDIDGAYAADSADAGTENDIGPKPSYHVDIPEFDAYRLHVYGLIIEAGLLAARGYPEYMADIIRKALVAHFHKMNAAKIAEIAAGSDAIAMPAGQLGATAPLLTALELQATHYRDTHRMAPDAQLEVAIPFWVVGALRSDLSRRLGVDLIDVNDARMLSWFSQRHLAAQFVQDYQSVSTTAATAFTAWPTSVQFLLYAAGTWVAGKSDVITLDTLYDSVNLKNNDFMALFTEEAQVMMKAGTDSRKVTCPISADGATHIGVEIAHSGAAV